MSAPYLKSDLFQAADNVRHGFFGRDGGVSTGDYAGLNVSYSVGDAPDAVATNRARVADTLGGGPLVILKQVHSNLVETVDDGALPDATVEADGLVTRRSDVLLGVLTADCAPLLFLDRHAGVIGAAHAGWKGAVNGIIENTLAAMEALGAQRKRIHIELGPTVSGPNYEVGPQFMRDAVAINPDAEPAFSTPPGGKEHFDLPRFLRDDAARAGAAAFGSRDMCTYANPERYFSHRYATHHDIKAGRQVAVIGLT